MNHVQPHRHLSLQTATPPRLGLALAPAPACIPPPAHLVRTRRCRVHVAQRQPENEVGGYAQWQEMDDNLYVYQPEEYDEEAFDDVIEVEGEDGTTRHVRMEDMVQEYVNWVNENISIRGIVELHRGRSGLPYVQLTHPHNGSSAQVYLHGACVTSWRKANGTEMLYTRDDGRWNPKRPIFGGIPVCFPQYRRGELVGHGFLQHVHWDVADAYVDDPDFHKDLAPTVVLHAESDEHTRQVWPYKFKAYYSISLADGVDEAPLVPDANDDDAADAAAHGKVPEGYDTGAKLDDDDGDELAPEPGIDEDCSKPAVQLTCTLQIRNTDDQPFEFCAALATTFATRDMLSNLGQVRSLGLGGKFLIDWELDETGMQPVLRVEDNDYLTFGGDGMVDRVYVDANADKGDVFVCPGDRTHVKIINRSGFRDIAAWHPPAHDNVMDRNQFVSMSSARISQPVKLYPGELWTGEMTLRAFDYYWQTPIFERGGGPFVPPKVNRQDAD